MPAQPCVRRQHGAVMLAVLVILSLGATAALAGAPASRLFQSEPPPNDNFADATLVDTFPFSTNVDTSAATIEITEPMYCTTMGSTVWYKLTPAQNTSYQVGTQGSSLYEASVTIWQGGSSGSLMEVTCSSYSGSVQFSGQGGETYYIQLGTPAGTSGGLLSLNVSVLPPPVNDNFAAATAIGELPYADAQDMGGATFEAGEPVSSCASVTPSRSIWYSYTPTADASLTAQAWYPWYYGTVTVFTGDSLGGLTSITCATQYGKAVFQAQKGVTYRIQVANIYPGDYGTVQFSLQATPPPQVSFYWYPYDPSKFDTVTFYDNSYDPVSVGISDYSWNFADGATATGYYATHKFAADGDYSVWHKVQTVDGRTAEITQIVAVRTHDIAITKFTVPQSASAGQTRQIVVGLRNYNYAEDVQVDLYKNGPSGYDGYVQIGTSRQQVPVRNGNRTTDFSFSYTFTKDDAKLGKVTFKAIATVTTARDALPADNEAISLPTKVQGK